MAEAACWAVYFDEPAGLDLGGRLRVRRVDFRSERAGPAARQFADATHLLAFGAGDEPPELWLNAAFEGLEGLLGDDGRPGRERGVRELVRADIARDAWLQLLAAAMAAIRVEDGGELAWPAAEWQRDVSKSVLPRVAPGKPDRELLELAAAEWRSQPGAGEFLSRAGAAVGEIIQANQAVRRMVQWRDGGDR